MTQDRIEALTEQIAGLSTKVEGLLGLRGQVETLGLKIEERFDRLADRITFSERQSAQLVQLQEQRLVAAAERIGRVEVQAESAGARVDSTEKRLSEHVGRPTHQGSQDHIRRLDDLERFRDLVGDLPAQNAEALRELREWKAKVIGIAIGVSLVGGGAGGAAAAAIAKALGG